MKVKSIVTLSLVLGLSASGTISGASPILKKVEHPVQSAASPELKVADQRVEMAKSQLETAKKQLNAARALVKAAEADFKAARADRQALALRTTADGLADSSGLKQLAQKTPVVSTDVKNRTEITETKPAVESDQNRLQQADFNSQPADSSPALR